MFIGVFHRRRWLETAQPLFFLVAAVLCLYRPVALATGVSRGLSVCSGVIIPTLYPFMILAGVLTESPLCRRPGRGISAVTRWLFGLPGCCGPAILLSLVGGYPAGALAIGRLLQQGNITREEAKRMTLFCVNGGPGFIISTVGSGLLGNVQAGLLLFLAHAGTSLVMGIVLGRGHRRGAETPPPPLAPARPIAKTVADSCSALLTMCGFVVLAAAILSLVEALGLPMTVQQLTGWRSAHISAALAAMLEVSCGCIALSGGGELTPLWLCLCMGWGGLSVQGQLAAALGEPGLLGKRFFAARLLHGAVSGGVAMGLFALIPVDLVGSMAVLKPGVGALPFSTTATASGMLLILSFFAMICFSPKNTGKKENNMLQ